MDELEKVWTTVGSAGILSQADLARVSLHESIVQLGVDVLPPVSMRSAAAQFSDAEALVGPNFPTIQAVVRYNVTPVEGLFYTGGRIFHYLLQIRCRGQISAKLMQVDIETGAETQLIPDASMSFQASPDFQVQTVWAQEESTLLDFVKNAYYVEATLIARDQVIGHPAAISIIKLIAKLDFI
jgi:hypothetical protein